MYAVISKCFKLDKLNVRLHYTEQKLKEHDECALLSCTLCTHPQSHGHQLGMLSELSKEDPTLQFIASIQYTTRCSRLVTMISLISQFCPKL